ncbi:tRNA (adenine(22)-N(1))-methyltransferase [Halalkalibacter urbisdiaboli]|uniref:tRNA (adenine(22)-N(1))-methyltransferase n=1 Tax=Halalkalibacter urbisdiaboli TaxID=1960589 RepID=UPI000B454809|nr:tRNA (adenine(22)-N(1))-methyltransferase TrmK [Halalkalibacter urbisdiaboli]
MNERQLSERLVRVANYVPNKAKVADIGSDHAYLPCYLCLQSDMREAIAGEVNEGPYQSALAQVKKVGLADRISVRKGNGLEVIEAHEVDVITIAGMGGSLIASILEDGKEKLTGVSRLILQPNVSAQDIRKWLYKHEWTLLFEEILEEDEKIYEILVAEKGNDEELYNEDKDRKLLLGPYLMKERNQAFRKKWKYELDNWKRILKQLEQAQKNQERDNKQKEIESNIQMVEEVLSWEKL